MFQKAVKKGIKARIAIMAVGGFGKTRTALEIGTGLGSKIALIDSENRSASRYADRYSFDVSELFKKGH